ncbi:hypothetical protein ACP70R_008302 [Stipagrostis hirtigluma subsp. patula]
MDVTSTALWFTITIIVLTVITKIARRRIMSDQVCNRPPPPPLVNGVSIIGTLLMNGFGAMIYEQYTKLGSVFTISILGKKIAFLIGPEVSGHFYQGLDSEVSLNIMYEFLVPMVGKDTGYGVDATTRNEQIRFISDALKPSKLRSHVGPMLQEVEDFFGKWGQEGVVDLKQELDQLLLLISAQCLLGKEVRANMFSEVFTLFHEMINNGTNLINVVFPYAPTMMNHRRDKAHTKLSKMFAEIVRSRKSSGKVEDDVLQMLIDSKYKDGRPTTESEVTGMIIGLLIAGKHTSSNASTWIGARLLSHRRYLTAAIEEQKQVFKKYGNHIDYSVLLEMNFLNQCIKETLRVHPPTLSLFRKVHKSFTVRTREGYEYEIPKGYTIASPVLFNNNISYIYKDPDVYDPNRFGPGREEDRVGGKFSYTAFGGGRHPCVGEAYAYMQIKVIWSHLLRNFELKLVSSFPKADWRKLALEPKGQVLVSYKRRQLHSA